MGTRAASPETREQVSKADPIVQQLRAARVVRELSQSEVAAMAGKFAHPQFSFLERGLRSPTLETLRAWAGALGFDIALVPKGQPDA